MWEGLSLSWQEPPGGRLLPGRGQGQTARGGWWAGQGGLGDRGLAREDLVTGGLTGEGYWNND